MLLNLYSESLKDSQIFIVDDEPVNLKLIERILKTEGYTALTTITEPHRVVEEFLNVRPQLIMLDINMPGLNGFEVIQQLQNIDNVELPPIVFLTAQNDHSYRTKAFECGVLDFICKPFNRLELLSRVKNLLALESAHHELSARNNSLEAAVEKRTEDLRKTQVQVVQKLGRAAEFRDNETGAHLLRMSNISALIAKHFNFNDEEVQNILYASPMHDVGKIAIPDHILLKPGKFEPEEWEIMKTHTTLGYDILNSDESALLRLASEIALYHHEKWNGTGYPYQLAEEYIPISCRIVAVADVFDALTSKRPYKKAWSVQDAHEFINEQSNQHFDPKIIKIFNKVFPQIIEIRDRYLDEDTEIGYSNMNKITVPEKLAAVAN
ncbi:MAG: two-component system response regulator [SAR86 cluster bacterium]|uniref:Two-component system response regulator n=1 Tax=SAR86 cluster bacterium TaxID=2030880 RepID=A0A2A5CAE4_9GAMM|nr:MAG: two-component system response regulator [SAR86 cluster bacterium]